LAIDEKTDKTCYDILIINHNKDNSSAGANDSAEKWEKMAKEAM
jgi:hypothetical protein